MRALFSILGLVIVMSIIFSVAHKQLLALKAVPTLPTVNTGAAAAGDRAGRLDAFPGAGAADPGNASVPQQSQNLQKQVANDVNRLMQQGPARAEGQ